MSKTPSDFENMNVSQLNLKKADLELKLNAVHASLSSCQVESMRLAKEIASITNELARRIKPAKVPRLSDHAVLRYIQRAFDIDIDSVKQRIMTPEVLKAISNGASGVTVDGVKFRVVDNVIVTAVIPETKKVRVKGIKPVDELKEGLSEFYDAE